MIQKLTSKQDQQWAYACSRSGSWFHIPLQPLAYNKGWPTNKNSVSPGHVPTRKYRIIIIIIIIIIIKPLSSNAKYFNSRHSDQ
jgi:hypothetical protein